MYFFNSITQILKYTSFRYKNFDAEQKIKKTTCKTLENMLEYLSVNK